MLAHILCIYEWLCMYMIKRDLHTVENANVPDRGTEPHCAVLFYYREMRTLMTVYGRYMGSGMGIGQLVGFLCVCGHDGRS